MARVKRGFKARRRRKRILNLAKGYRGTRNSNFRTAVHVVRRALCYAYRDRKAKKRTFRNLWVTRINAAARMFGLRYSELIHGLKKANITMDRTILAELAATDIKTFGELVGQAKLALAVSHS